MTWEDFWSRLAKIPYGSATVVKVRGHWHTVRVVRSVRFASSKGPLTAAAAVRAELDRGRIQQIEREFDNCFEGELYLEKHEGQIVSYRITEQFSPLESGEATT